MSISENLQQLDWCNHRDQSFFINEIDMDNCTTEKILRNKFYDPLISSESDNETPNKIDWSEVFKKNNPKDKLHRIYVPGVKPLLKNPKLSALTRQQQFQLLKVICAQNPTVLETEFVARPNKTDFRVFEELKSVYEKEQEEFKDWARSLWASGHNIRALRPNPLLEMHYDAEFNIRAKQLESFPKTYGLCAQIPLEINQPIEMIFDKEILKVTVRDLPQLLCPDMVITKLNVLRPSSVPEPCNKHPCKFVLPTENKISVLPLTEVHKELAQYCLDNGGDCIASEGALRCLVQHDTAWIMPVSVCSAIGPDGEYTNVLVLGSDVSHQRHPAQLRTYKALRHLTLYALLPPKERAKIANGWKQAVGTNTSKDIVQTNPINDNESNKADQNMEDNESNKADQNMKDNESNKADQNMEDNESNKADQNMKDNESNKADQNMEDSSDDEDNMFIDTGEENKPMEDNDKEMTDVNENVDKTANRSELKENNKEINEKDNSNDKDCSKENFDTSLGLYECTCTGTMFEKPPPRSYKKWHLKNNTANEKISLIVHCAHKARDGTGEVVLDPIPEYQLELGGTAMSKTKAKVLALALHLRRKASLLNVRIDVKTGDVVTMDNMQLEELKHKHGDIVASIANSLYCALDQLRGLLPGDYVLQHEITHGANAMLYASSPATSSTLDLSIRDVAADADETKHLIAPELEPVLLPAHKLRKIIPCAFTTQECHLQREMKKPITRQKAPPQAIRWPKKKGKKKKKMSN